MTPGTVIRPSFVTARRLTPRFHEAAIPALAAASERISGLALPAC